jgi:hypothetical protein
MAHAQGFPAQDTLGRGLAWRRLRDLTCWCYMQPSNVGFFGSIADLLRDLPYASRGFQGFLHMVARGAHPGQVVARVCLLCAHARG